MTVSRPKKVAPWVVPTASGTVTTLLLMAFVLLSQFPTLRPSEVVWWDDPSVESHTIIIGISAGMCETSQVNIIEAEDRITIFGWSKGVFGSTCPGALTVNPTLVKLEASCDGKQMIDGSTGKVILPREEYELKLPR